MAYSSVLVLSLATTGLEIEDTTDAEETDGAESMEETVRTTIQIKLGLQNVDPTPNMLGLHEW